MAAGATYEPIATNTLSSSAASITFSSIAATYTDLRLIIFGVYTSSSFAKFTLNSDSGTNYSNTRIAGFGTGVSSDRTTDAVYQRISFDGHTSTVPNFLTVDFFSYAGSTNKTYLITNSDDKNGSGAVYNAVGLWRNTSAINTILLQSHSGNFNTGTTATLYGIKNA